MTTLGVAIDGGIRGAGVGGDTHMLGGAENRMTLCAAAR